MAYAGVLSILQTYKMQKTDSDFNLILLQNEVLDKAQGATAVDTVFASQKTAALDAFNEDVEALNKDDPDYRLDYQQRKEEYDMEIEAILLEQNSELAVVQAEEEEWQMKLDKEQTKNAMLQTNIESFQSMLESNIAKSHTYGYSS